MKKLLSLILMTIALILAGLVITVWAAGGRFFGSARWKAVPIKEGNFFPENTRNYMEYRHSGLKDYLLDYWSAQPLTDWEKHCKVEIPRIVLACLYRKKRVDEVNAYLLRQQPAGVTGSTWKLNPHGDYDFTLLGLTPLLYLFGDRPDLLYPATRQHLIKVLLTTQDGRFERSVPRTCGLIEDTENHLLMTNGSCYLKNRWLRLHGDTSAAPDNGMEEKLLDYLKEIYDCGIYEFNADPYEGYTLSALLNLQAFGGDSIRLMAGKILDRLNWEYAFGSYHFKRFPPFRRRYDRANRTNLEEDYHGAMMKTWVSLFGDSLNINVKRGMHHALWAAVMPYRPPDGVIDLVLHKADPYYVKIGHGWNSGPEIYSVGRDYFLSAGGVNRGKRSMIIARPIILITDPAENELQDVFHVAGPGERFMDWNNTGVYNNFACAAGPVYIPAGRKPVATDKGWKIFQVKKDICLAIYSTQGLGIMAICRSSHPGRLLQKIIAQNPGTDELKTQFHHPDGDIISYDVKAPHDKWVITAVNHQAVDRDFDHWPFFDLMNDDHQLLEGMKSVLPNSVETAEECDATGA